MKIAEKLAGYTLVEADGLRKDMVKKIPKVIANQRERFVNGAVRNNIPKEAAIELFGIIEKYAGYGFNKPHSAAYALIAFQTAYLKAHFPVEYMAAVLTFEINSSESIIKYIADCRSHNISILHPDINESNKGFTVSGKAIRFGLAAVKDVSEEAIESIIKTRENGKYESLIDFCGRVDIRKVNKQAIKSLISSGAFDSTGLRRSQMIAVLEPVLQYCQKIELSGCCIDPNELNPPAMPDIPEWDEKQKLALEKEATGLYLSWYLLDFHRE
jgi:DNA polymerase-3 subunit alpha